LAAPDAGADFKSELPQGKRLLRKPCDFEEPTREMEAGVGRIEREPSSAPVLPSGVPPHTGVELGNGVGAVAASTTESDKM
jgi:two-component system, response regulator PdtaR